MNLHSPRRIASLLASGTEILYGMGLGDRVVAVSHECDFPPEVAAKPRVTTTRVNDRADSGQIDAQVQQMVQAGDPLYEIDERLLAQLGPDLIVTQAQCDVCAVRYEDVMAAVRRHPQLESAQVLALNPMNLPDIFHDISRVGVAAGASESARAYHGELLARVESIREVTLPITAAERPRVVLIEWIDPVMLAGNWMPELVQIAGGQAGLAMGGQHSVYADWTRVLEYDPEVIVVMPCGLDLARTMEESRTLDRLDGWETLAAVRSGRVYAVDANAYFSRAGPRIVDSLEMLAHWLHPERFPAPGRLADRGVAWQPLG